MSTSIESRLRGHLASVDSAVVADPDAVLVASRSRRRRLDRRRRGAVVFVSVFVSLCMIGGGIAVVARNRTVRTIRTVATVATVATVSEPASNPTATTAGMEAVTPGATPSNTTVSSAPVAPTTIAAAADPSTTASRSDAFSPLPEDPRGPAASPSVVWTGDEAIVVGGRDANGAPVHGTSAYRPSTNTWRRLADPPFGGGWVDALVAWTGDVMLVIGGDNPDGSLLVSGGSAYRPGTDSWTAIASPPVGFVSDRSPFVWTGSELLVWPWDGGGPSMPITPIGYDPGTDTWRELPEPPVLRRQQAASVWTGSEWIVWGGATATSELDDGAAYDPATNTWRPLAAAPLAPRRVGAVWTGSEMLVTAGASGGERPSGNGELAFGDGAAYSPATDTWRPLTDGPAHPGFVPIWTGRELVLFAKGGAAVYDPATDRWLTGCCDGDAAYGAGSPVWTGTQVLVVGSITSALGGATFSPPPA